MLTSIFAAMLLSAAGQPEIKVDVGVVNLSTLPALNRTGPRIPTGAMVAEVERILASGTCTIDGQTSRKFDIDVPFAVLMKSDGSADHVVVSDMGCPELESFAGLIALELAQRGHLHPSSRKAQWYGSSLNFNQEVVR